MGAGHTPKRTVTTTLTPMAVATATGAGSSSDTSVASAGAGATAVVEVAVARPITSLWRATTLAPTSASGVSDTTSAPPSPAEVAPVPGAYMTRMTRR